MSEQEIVALSLGSNIGNRESNIKKAVALLEKEIGVTIKKSPVFETPPLYYTEQDDFYNCCVTFKSGLPVREIHNITKKIERKLGRKKTGILKGPRAIDIDIIFAGKNIIIEEDLKVPHIDMQNRLFVLKPLSYIMGDFEHPDIQTTVNSLLKECPDGSNLKRVSNFW